MKYTTRSATVLLSMLSMLLFESCLYKDEPIEINQAKIDNKNVFTLSNKYVYAISDDRLVSFQLENGLLKPATGQFDAQNAEAVYVKDTLLIVVCSYTAYRYGSMALSINESGSIKLLARLDLLPCDQVVIKDQYLIQSIRDGTECRLTANNSLVITDLTNPASSVLALSVATPFGLSIDGDVLFVAQGDNGMAIYNIQDPSHPSLMQRYSEIKGEYINAVNGHLIVTNKDAISQYDYSDINNIKLLSSIAVH